MAYASLNPELFRRLNFLFHQCFRQGECNRIRTPKWAAEFPSNARGLNPNLQRFQGSSRICRHECFQEASLS